MSGVGVKEIKRRKAGIESTRQITNAMNLVSSSKLIRAREAAELSKPYAYFLYDMVLETAADVKKACREFVEKREVKRRCFIVVAGDRGLAGGYNMNIFREAESLMNKDTDMVIPIGKKSCEFFRKRGYNVVDEINSVETCKYDEIDRITKLITEKYKNKEVDEATFIYTKFRSAIIQTVRVKTLFPVALEMMKPYGKEKSGDEKKVSPRRQYYPSAEEVFRELISEYTASQIYNGIKESFASEQASRRNAMQSATDSADDMLAKLDSEFNRARQASITREITEIAGGAEALK